LPESPSRSRRGTGLANKSYGGFDDGGVLAGNSGTTVRRDRHQRSRRRWLPNDRDALITLSRTTPAGEGRGSPGVLVVLERVYP